MTFFKIVTIIIIIIIYLFILTANGFVPGGSGCFNPVLLKIGHYVKFCAHFGPHIERNSPNICRNQLAREKVNTHSVPNIRE
jgi:hypothetical protein